MSTWLTETEFRQSGAASAGVTINVAFLQEIKQDFGFRGLLNKVYYELRPIHQSDPSPSPHRVAELLGSIRDELETYFALEEFYGYLNQPADPVPVGHDTVSALQQDHERLFLRMNSIVELAEQIAYHECSLEIERAIESFEDFCRALAEHEQAEKVMMSRLKMESKTKATPNLRLH